MSSPISCRFPPARRQTVANRNLCGAEAFEPQELRAAPPQKSTAMAQKLGITTGTNDRPRNETVGQSGEGLPGSTPLEVDEAAVARLGNQLQGKPEQFGEANADAAGVAAAGEKICHRCAGTGMIDGRTCPECGGTGKVTTPIS
jgi:hypothetical protein